MKLLIFDTETTSVRPGNICQLTYILIDASKKPQTTIGKNFFFTVDDMEEGAEAIHGFSLEKLYELSEGRDFLDTVHEFMPDFFEADFIIATKPGTSTIQSAGRLVMAPLFTTLK